MTVKERLSRPDAQSLKQVWLKKANGWMFPAMHPGTIIRLHGEAEVIDAGTAKDGELVLHAQLADGWHSLPKTRRQNQRKKGMEALKKYVIFWNGG